MRKNLGWYICSFLLIIHSQQTQVFAYLNILDQSIELGRELRKQVAEADDYCELEEVVGKLKEISDLVLPFIARLNEVSKYIVVDIQPADRTLSCVATRLNDYYTLQNVLAQDHINDLEESLRNGNWTEYLVNSKFVKELMTEKMYVSHKSLDILTDLIRVLSDKKYESDNDCRDTYALESAKKNVKECRVQSHQQLFYNTMLLVLLMLARYNLLVQFTYAAHQIESNGFENLDVGEQRRYNETRAFWSGKNLIEEMKNAENDIYNKSNQPILNIYKVWMVDAPLNVRPCQADAAEGVTFVKLRKVFRKYIANEADMREDTSCYYGDCQGVKMTKVYQIFRSEDSYNLHQDKCLGSIQSCDPRGSNIISTCFMPSSRRGVFDFLETDHEKFGKQFSPSCYHGNKKVSESFKHDWGICQYCTCICDESMLPDSDKYFNLKPVMSDVKFDRIVTGLRFRIVKNVVHIQIKEGLLERYGAVKYSEWKPVDAYNVTDARVNYVKDYHEIKWGDSSFQMDSFKTPTNYTITGVKLHYEDNRLGFRIHVTKFDFETGKLWNEYNEWLPTSKSVQNSGKLHLDHLDQDIVYGAGQVFDITASAIEFDAGQSTFPYFETQSVENQPNVPLSGAELILKNYDVGPVLGFNLFTLDFTPYLNLPVKP